MIKTTLCFLYYYIQKSLKPIIFPNNKQTNKKIASQISNHRHLTRGISLGAVLMWLHCILF